MPGKPPIGTSDFRLLRQEGQLYVDKTRFVCDVLGSGAWVQLFCRPRRFGKTLNLSTLRYFVERTNEDRQPLFEGLEVWSDGGARAHFARHPVVWLSFKDVKAPTWPEARQDIASLIGEEGRRLAPMVGDGPEAPGVGRLADGSASDADLRAALRTLCRGLAGAAGEGVVVLVDEYDTPIHAAARLGYYEEAIAFFRAFWGAGLKDNADLYKGVMTGILRVAKEGIFSGLNHVRVDTVLDARPSAQFGFTDREVAWLRAQAGSAITEAQLRDWYDGYRVGDATLYNPWSVLACLDADVEEPTPQWVRTGGTDALDSVVWEGDVSLVRSVQAWLRGETVEQVVPDAEEIGPQRPGVGAATAMLVHGGYLTPVSRRREDDGLRCGLRVPNRDVMAAFRDLARGWIDGPDAGTPAGDLLVRALLGGDEEAAGRLLSDILLRSFSYHLPAGPQPEKVFHAFVAGLLVRMSATHDVWTEAESGHGRADVLALPRAQGGAGFVMELKRLGEGQVESEGSVGDALDDALRQIDDRDYCARLRERGAGRVLMWGVVFEGKRAWMRLGR